MSVVSLAVSRAASMVVSMAGLRADEKVASTAV